MHITDFKKSRIKNIKPEDIERSGAGLKNVPLELIIEADKFIKNLHRKVAIRPNGLITGVHTIQALHEKGKAIDLSVGRIVFEDALHAALKYTNFRGIGFYRDAENNIVLHLDLREKYSFWVAHKIKGKWKYINFPSQVI